jgi:hypothetical protein
MAKKQPGVMLYFEVRPCLERLTMAERGALFTALLDYGETGAAPDFDGALGMAWDFMRLRADRDRARYAERVEQLRQAAGRRWERDDKRR